MSQCITSRICTFVHKIKIVRYVNCRTSLCLTLDVGFVGQWRKHFLMPYH